MKSPRQAHWSVAIGAFGPFAQFVSAVVAISAPAVVLSGFLTVGMFAADVAGAEQNVDAAGKYHKEPGPPSAPLSEKDQKEAEAKLRDTLKVERDGPGRFRIGEVIVDSERRVVTFPATVNMDAGNIEYAVVTETGKVHEALLKTAAKPEQIHLACLLLGMSPEKGGDGSRPTATDLKVTVTWETNGPLAEHDLSQFVVISEDGMPSESSRTLPIGPWSYTGSVMDFAGFAASREGSVIALISDPSALISNPREGAKRDDHHFPNKALLPAKDTPLRIVLIFPKISKTANSSRVPAASTAGAPPPK